MSQFYANILQNNTVSDSIIEIVRSEFKLAGQFHRSINGYSPTPLYSLKALASQLGVGNIIVKDESFRLGLNAFKGLGASFAIYKFIARIYFQKTGIELTTDTFWNCDFKKVVGEIVFCTATDGNHGRAVAWMANQIGCKSEIYLPSDSVTARIKNIQQEGAVVHIVDGGYDDAVFKASEDSTANDWVLISDSSTEGYEEIPLWISAGYNTIFAELEKQLSSAKLDHPDIVLIQTGVGALAVTAAGWQAGLKSQTHLVCVEPESAACLLESVQSGLPQKCTGSQKTIMAGLNCGTPSKVAFEVMRSCFDLFVTIEDKYAVQAMRAYANPVGQDKKVISGESGAGSLAGLIALCKEEKFGKARELIGLNKNSTVMLINTEGATDQDNYDRILAEKQL